MSKLRKSVLPEHVLLARYNDAYTDCYTAHVNSPVDLKAFVETFYTGRLFRIERWLITKTVKHRSSDTQLAQMLGGQSNRFSAWTIEDRTDSELLMCDYQNRTRSWFMVERSDTGTILYFGSAVVPTDYLENKTERFAGFVFKALMPFHKLYSRLLLGSARRRLRNLPDLVA